MSDYLPLDIITEILIRAPVDAVLRSRCVSKEWRDLIDSPPFAKLQTRNATLVLVDNRRDLLVHPFPHGLLHEVLIDFGAPTGGDVPADGQIELYGCCDGLLCFGLDHQVAVANLATENWQFSPRLLGEELETLKEFSEISFSTFYEAGYGFGYDSASDEYKMILVLHFLGTDGKRLESLIIDFGIRSSTLQTLRTPYLIFHQKMGVFVSGGLHWMGGMYDGDVRSLDMIVQFDLGLGQTKEIPQPNYAEGGGMELVLGELRRCLCIFDNCKGRFVDVWMMKEYGVVESWMKLFSAPYPGLCYEAGIRPLGFSLTGGELLMQLDDQKLVWYDMKKCTVEEITLHGPEGTLIDSVLCSSSLVSPDGKFPPAQVTTDELKRDGLLSTGFNKLKL